MVPAELSADAEMMAQFEQRLKSYRWREQCAGINAIRDKAQSS